MKFTSDIDIDFANRDSLLEKIEYTTASIKNSDNTFKKHNTGIHPTYIPHDPVNNFSAIDYKEAESRGYLKIDLLNVWVYKLVQNEDDLKSLMREPNWDNLNNKEFFEKIVHIGNHYSSMHQMLEPINSIPRMAMFLALIRPGKKHLLGKSWHEVSKTIWDRGDDGYQFKKSHAIAYAHLVVVHMNLLEENRGELEVFSES